MIDSWCVETLKITQHSTASQSIIISCEQKVVIVAKICRLSYYFKTVSFKPSLIKVLQNIRENSNQIKYLWNTIVACLEDNEWRCENSLNHLCFVRSLYGCHFANRNLFRYSAWYFIISDKHNSSIDLKDK